MSPSRPLRRRNRLSSPALPPPVPLQASSTVMAESLDGILSYRWVWYFLSVFVPLAGILIALFLYDQESREIRKIGRNCLLVSFVLWIVFPILVFMLLLLVGIVAAAGLFSSVFSATD